MAPWWHVVERATLAATSLAVETDGGMQVFDTWNKRKKIQTAETLHHMLWRAPEQRRAQETIAIARQAGLDLRAFANELFMDWTELGEIAALPGCTIGAHTTSHPKLAHLEEAAAKREISEGRDIIRERLGVKVDHFSYPYGGAGICDEREFAMVRAAGFTTAVTTRKNVLHPTNINGLMNLPRVPINGHFQHPAMIDALVCGLPMVLTRMNLQRINVTRGAAAISVPGN
jgi:peptidoglycan/xylan/chitin deacetylase (PgdA/CDA1 family)